MSQSSSLLLLLRDQDDNEAHKLFRALSLQLDNKVVELTIHEVIGSNIVYTFDGIHPKWSLEHSGWLGLQSNDVVGAVVAATSLPPSVVDGIAGVDRLYAYQEISAALCALLAAVRGPVINRPWPHSLSGRNLTRARWSRLAHEAGLRVSPLDCASSTWPVSDGQQSRVFVIEEQIVCDSPLPIEIEAGLHRLSSMVSERAFVVDFKREPDWQVVRIKDHVDQDFNNPLALAALARMVRQQ